MSKQTFVIVGARVTDPTTPVSDLSPEQAQALAKRSPGT
jgi:hypothetical protein